MFNSEYFHFPLGIDLIIATEFLWPAVHTHDVLGGRLLDTKLASPSQYFRSATPLYILPHKVLILTDLEKKPISHTSKKN